MAMRVEQHDDPYKLTPEGIREPPTGWRGSFRYLGPGLVVSASIVGSGELIATTALGAEAGFALLWMVIIGTSVKVAVQVELARWTISTGQPALEGYNKVGPRIAGVGWINILWALMALAKILQTGGIVGAVAIAFSLLVPLGPDPVEGQSVTIWVVIVVATSIALLVTNKYSRIERGAFLLVALFALFTVLIALGLPFTTFAYEGSDLLDGLRFAIPAGTVGAAVAMFGITGVGADEITVYTYWCVDKGYARWAGPPDGTDEWARRARGWIRVMYKDAFISWVIYTFSTLAFFIMGAAVLHPQGLVVEGTALLETLSRMYTDLVGEWANVIFLVGAIVVLGSTLWAAIPSWARMFSSFCSIIRLFDWSDGPVREKWIRGFIVVLPIVWGGTYLIITSPVIMVQIGGVATGIFLLAVLVAMWYLRNNEVDERLYGARLFHLLLVVSSIAIAVLGVYTVASVFGFEIGG